MSKNHPPEDPQASYLQMGNLKHDKTKKLTNDTPGGKFLIMARNNAGQTMANVSVFLAHRAVLSVGGKVESMRKLKDNTFLIKTANLSQAKNLITLTQLDNGINVTISEHAKLNYSKGVVRAPELIPCCDEEILENLQDQNVVEIYRLKKKISGKEVDTGTYFFTFSTVKLPEKISIGFEIKQVRPYIPNPLRCYSCLAFNHTANNCQKGIRRCLNCAQEVHTAENERCEREPACVNCTETGHSSVSKACPAFQKQVEIQKIRIFEDKSIAEATKEYNIRHPVFNNGTFASQFQRKSCGCACDCGKIKEIGKETNTTTKVNVPPANLNPLSSGNVEIASTSSSITNPNKDDKMETFDSEAQPRPEPNIGKNAHKHSRKPREDSSSAEEPEKKKPIIDNPKAQQKGKERGKKGSK